MSNLRLDPTKPEDLKRLIATGLIWSQAVPVEYKQRAIDALVNGTVETPDNLPADVMNEVNRLRNESGRAPLELPGDVEGDADGNE